MSSSVKNEKKKAKDKGQGQQLAVDVIDESHREFYLVQIKDLESRIEKLQKVCDEKDITNSLLREKFSKNSSDQQDIVAYVQKKLAEKVSEVSRMEQEVDEVENQMRDEAVQFETQREQILHDFHVTKDQLQNENSTLATKLASLSDLKTQREDLYGKIDGLEADLKRQAEEHRDTKYDIEKRHIMDKDRLKKEMQEQIETMSRNFRESSNDQLLERTECAIQKNVVSSQQLHRISAAATQQLADNNMLLKQVSDTKLRKEILSENARQLANKYNYYTEKINTYKDKLNNLNNEDPRFYAELDSSSNQRTAHSTSSVTNDDVDETSRRLRLPSLNSNSSLCSYAH